MVYTVFYKTSSFAGYCFLGKNSIHQKRYDVFSFKAFKLTLVKFQICSFIDINNILCSSEDERETLSGENQPPEPDKKTDLEQDKEDFEKIYGAYPQKAGEAKALEYYRGYVGKGRVINGTRYHLDRKEIYLAVVSYVRQMEEEGTQLQFYKNFDTFMNKAVLDYRQKGRTHMIVNPEKALIGALMMNPQAVRECGSLLPEMFTDALLGRIYLEYVRAYDFGYPANLVTLAENMPDIPQPELLECLKQCTDSSVTSVAAEKYGEAIVNAYKARKASQIINVVTFQPADIERQIGQLDCITRFSGENENSRHYCQ